MNLLVKAIQLINKNPLLFFGFFLVTILTIFNLSVTKTDGHYAKVDLLGGDSATFVLVATSHHQGLGIPYKDFWEYRPPGYYFLLDLWSRIFGVNVFSFKLLEVIFRFLVGIEICLLVKKIFKSFQGFFILLFTLFIFYSPAFGIWLYPEAYGIFFSLLGLIFLLYIKGKYLRLFLASLFFSFALQIKDIFGGVFLSFAPFFFYAIFKKDFKLFVKYTFAIVLPVVLTFVILYLYLYNLKALDAYFEVLKFKSGLYPLGILENLPRFINRYFSFIWNSFIFITHFKTYKILILYTIIFILIVVKLVGTIKLQNIKNRILITIPSLKISIDSYIGNLSIVILFCFGLMIGPSVMVLISPHYVFPAAIPFCLLSGVVTSSISALAKKNIFFTNLLFLIIFFTIFIPRKWLVYGYLEFHPQQMFKQAALNLLKKEGDKSLEQYINLKTEKNDCILSIYGWKSTDMYLYSQRKPCSRFILPNIIIQDWQRQEYITSIINNPPKAVVYTLVGADMDYKVFEEYVINFSKILYNCYDQDYKFTFYERIGWGELKLYFSKFENPELKNCVIKNIK